MSFSIGGDVNRDVTITFIGKDQASSSMRSISSSATKTTGVVGRLSKMLGVSAGTATAAMTLAAGAATALAAAAAATAVAVAGTAYAIYDATKAAYEDNIAMKKLAFTQRKAQDATREQTKATARWIDHMELATRFADDDLRPAYAALALTGMKVKESQDLMTVAMDVAEAKGKPLLSVAEALAKAYNGNTAGLGRLGVATKDASGDALSFAEILKNLRKRTEGAAKAAAKKDPWTTLGHAFQQVKEKVGSAFLPILRQLAQYIIKKVVPWVKQEFIPALRKFSRWIKDEAVPWIRGKLIPALEDWWQTFREDVLPALQEIWRKLQTTWKTIQKVWQWFQKLTGEGTAVRAALEMIKAGFGALMVPLRAALGLFEGLMDAFNWIINNAGRVIDAIRAAKDAGSQWLSDHTFGIAGGSAAGGWLPRAQGGWLVGEHGPEVINPRGFVKTHSQTMGAGTGGTINITVNAVDGPGAGRAVEKVLAKYARATGRGALAVG